MLINHKNFLIVIGLIYAVLSSAADGVKSINENKSTEAAKNIEFNDDIILEETVETNAMDTLLLEDVISIDSDDYKEILDKGNTTEKSDLEKVNMLMLPNGSLYSGDIKYDVIREGKGENSWPNGDTYTGDWLNDLPHGKGSMRRKNKDNYRGSFSYGQYSGLGELILHIGERYIGEFRFNRLDGLGIYVSANDEYYLGEFSQQKRHGRLLYFSGLSAKPKYQLWFEDNLEKVIDIDSNNEIIKTPEQQLINQMIGKFEIIAKKRLEQRKKNTHYQIRGRVRKIVSDVDDTVEHTYGDLIINLLNITE